MQPETLKVSGRLDDPILVRRKTVQQPGTTGSRQVIFAASGGAVRRVPGHHVARGVQPDPVVMPHDGRAFAM